VIIQLKYLVLVSLSLALLILPALAGCSQGEQKQYPERQVTFVGNGGARLAASLTLPDHTSQNASPGLVLIAGSGPTDRDGNSGLGAHTDLLKQVAQRLAQAGVASLRYDKRGVGGSAMSPQDQAHLADYVSWENFVGDAVAALRFLQSQPGVDAARTGFLGHSEGGVIALQAAQQIKGQPQPARLLVLVSTPGRPMDMVFQDQLVKALKSQHATAIQTDYFLAENQAIVTAIKKTGVVPDNVPAGLVALYPPYIGKFYRSALQLDPAKLAARFPGPVLIIQGQKDIQVSPSKDAPLLDTALSSRPHGAHRLFLVPGASHNLKQVADKSNPGLEGPVTPQALSVLCDWLHDAWARGNSPGCNSQ